MTSGRANAVESVRVAYIDAEDIRWLVVAELEEDQRTRLTVPARDWGQLPT